MPQLARLPQLGAAIAAGVCAYLLKDLPYQLGLFAAVLVGVGVGLALVRWRGRGKTRTEAA